MKQRENKLHLLSSRLYCRLWNFTKSAFRLVGCTTGREFHPALKMQYFVVTLYIARCIPFVKPFIFHLYRTVHAPCHLLHSGLLPTPEPSCALAKGCPVRKPLRPAQQDKNNGKTQNNPQSVDPKTPFAIAVMRMMPVKNTGQSCAKRRLACVLLFRMIVCPVNSYFGG